jgi:hypothetical protein
VASAATVGVLAVPLAGCGSGADGAGKSGTGGAASSVRAVGAENVTPEAFLARVEAGRAGRDPFADGRSLGTRARPERVTPGPAAAARARIASPA